jgi:hypothetical protein
MTGTRMPPGDAPAARGRWGTDAPPASNLHVVTRDITVVWDHSEIRVEAGTLVHAEPGSALWRAYGGEDGLRSAHRARP